MCTVTPEIDAGKWVGYQILTGAGRGKVTQLVSRSWRQKTVDPPLAKTNEQPVDVVLPVLSGDEIAIGTLLLACSQYLGEAIFIWAAKTLFNNDLVSSLHQFAPK